MKKIKQQNKTTALNKFNTVEKRRVVMKPNLSEDWFKSLQ